VTYLNPHLNTYANTTPTVIKNGISSYLSTATTFYKRFYGKLLMNHNHIVSQLDSKTLPDKVTTPQDNVSNTTGVDLIQCKRWLDCEPSYTATRYSKPFLYIIIILYHNIIFTCLWFSLRNHDVMTHEPWGMNAWYHIIMII